MKDEKKTKAQLIEELEELRLRTRETDAKSSERKRAEDDLRETRDYLDSLIGYANAPIITWGPDMRITCFNRAFERLTGYSADEVLGQKLAMLFPEDRREESLQEIDHTISGEYWESVEIPILRKDGDIKLALWNSANIYAKDGKTLVSVIAQGQDITERKRLEEEQRESEKRYRTLFQRTANPILVIDMKGNYIDCNDAALEFLESTRDELLTKNIRNFIPPSKERLTLEEHVPLWETGGSAETEYFIHSKVKFLELTITPIIWNGKQGAIGIGKDITKRKRAEEELRESEEKYRELVQNANSMIIRFDTRGRLTFFNEFAQRFFEYPEEEVLGKSIVGTIVPDKEVNRRDLAEIIEEIASSPKTYKTREYRNMRRDGERVWVAWTNKAVVDESGRVTEILGVGVDITEIREIQRRLEKLNSLFLSLGADIIENIEAIVRTGKEILGGALMQYCRLQEGRLASISTAPGEEGFKVTTEPENHVCYPVISKGSDKPLIIEDLRETPYEETYPEIKKHGLRSFAGYPVKPGKETIGCLSLWDRGKRGFSQEELDILGNLARAISVEEERLAREEGLKDFIDIASHELRHPITLMKGYAASLRDLWGKLEDEKRMEMLDGIDHGADRMDKLSRELLEVSRIERGRFRLYRREVPLEPLVERAVSEMGEKGLKNRFNLSIPGDTGARKVDPERIVELMIILLDNAVQFSSPSSEIDIEIGTGDEGVLISVLDRGQGVLERDRERVFERFYQVEEALHHSKPGIGLGLYIAREIVEAHGGRIWYEPREGGGSIFRFTIPL